MRILVVYTRSGLSFAGRDGRNKLAAVVINAEEVERRAAQLDVARLHSHQLDRIGTNKGSGIFSLHRRLNEPHVPERMRAVGGLAVLFRIGGGLAVRHAEGRAHLKLGVDRFDGAERLSLRDVHYVRCTHALGEILSRGRVNPPRIAEKREDPRLIENAPVTDTVTRSEEHTSE